MKASALGYGGILLMLIIFSIVVIFIIGGAEPVNRSIVTLEGKLISFENFANMFIKMFDQSIEFVSQRAAYDLGNNGGLIGIGYWTNTRPTMNELKRALGMMIKERLPHDEVREGDRSIIWGDSTIEISENTGVCGSTVNSKCFFVNGEKILYIYEEGIDTKISLDPYEFSIKVDSNYLKLLNAGRAIMEEIKFSTPLSDGDLNTLLNEFQSDSRFSGLYLTAENIGDAVEITISERCFPPDTYCLSPLKSGETGELSIPYDYNKLKFIVGGSATPATCSGTVALDCDPPDDSELVHPGFDQRFWEDDVCGRSNALIDCDGTEGSNKVCNADGFCEKILPHINGYAISDLSINVNEEFTISVNSNCFSGLPGKCLVECRVIHPDGYYIELDSWDEDGKVTLSPVKCNKVGDYVVSYCGIFTDFYKNGGWGERKDTDIIVTCS